MAIEALKAQRRETKGSVEARRLRRQGKVPAVLYGHGEDVRMFALTAESVHDLVESGHHLVTLDLGDGHVLAGLKRVE